MCMKRIFVSWSHRHRAKTVLSFYGHSRNTFGYYMFGDIGYRFTADNGFQLRVGMNPSLNFGDAHGLKKELFFPYVSFGFAF